MKFVTALVSALLTVAPATAVFAQATNYLSENRAAYRAHDAAGHVNGVMVNGRCRGMSYGTGARSCGTASGGPVGGISGRN